MGGLKSSDSKSTEKSKNKWQGSWGATALHSTANSPPSDFKQENIYIHIYVKMQTKKFNFSNER